MNDIMTHYDHTFNALFVAMVMLGLSLTLLIADYTALWAHYNTL